ncbi:MAG: NfeD family protein [Synechococcus sp.]
MATLYWFCLIVGGCFVLLASISGIDGVEFGEMELGDVEFEGELGDGLDMDVEVRERSPEDRDSPFELKPSRPTLWIPFASLRFWTFGACFFGLTGLLLTVFAPTLSSSTRALIAIAFGVTSATVMTGILRMLRRRPANSLIRTSDLIGKVGIVEVPFDATSPGKIRLSLRNVNVAFLACTDDPTPLNTDDRVVVIREQDNRLWVVSEAAFQSSKD